jgi:hypothetical protein
MRLQKPDEMLAAGDVEGFLAWHRQQPYGGMVMGPDGEGEGQGQQGENGGAGAPPPPPPGTHTGATPVGYVPQDQVSAIAAREKDQGERAGRRKLLADLGFDPETTKPEDVKALLDKQREQEQAHLSEAERREAAAAERERVAEEQIRAANATAHSARLTTALVTQGVATAALDDARTLLATVPADADDAALTEAVGKLKERLPALFGSAAPPPPPGGGFQGTPPRPQANGDAYAKGRERAIAAGLAPAPATP